MFLSKRSRAANNYAAICGVLQAELGLLIDVGCRCVYGASLEPKRSLLVTGACACDSPIVTAKYVA